MREDHGLRLNSPAGAQRPGYTYFHVKLPTVHVMTFNNCKEACFDLIFERLGIQISFISFTGTLVGKILLTVV